MDREYKNSKILDKGYSYFVYLTYQVSDKRQLPMMWKEQRDLR